ncbi:MAG: hypothetical protein AMXMBFR47_24430 [Planctomycetota bacterium]
MFIQTCFRRLAAALLAGLAAAAASAQTFQVVVAETPQGAGGGQPVERFAVSSQTNEFIRLSDIPGSMLDDPVSVVFRSADLLLVSNRDAHAGGGSISTFMFGEDFTTYTQGPTITGNGVTDPVQMAFNPADGELFVTNWNTNVLSRFRFDGSGEAVPNGTIQMPDTQPQLGVAVRMSDQQLFVSSYSFVRRFTRQAGGAYVHHSNFTIPGGVQIHFMKFRGDELYICDFGTSAVYRFTFDADGNPVPNGSVSSNGALDVAFSPAGDQMYVASHAAGGISRFAYNAGSDGWDFVETVPTPRLGGIAVTALAACYGDLNGDRAVGLADLTILLAHFGETGTVAYQEGNMDGAAGVGLQDLTLLLAEFGKICD